ncbi:MAG: hypothetical protein SGBAC_010598 [Bacillariaceae sp.]
MNAEFPILPSHVSTPTRRSGGLGAYTRPSQLLSTPRSHRTPTRSTSRKKTFVPRMSPSPRVGRTPVSTATKRNASTVGDRFIPSRRSMNVDMCRRSLFSEEPIDEEAANDTPCSQQMKKFKKTLLSSLCDYPIESLDDNANPKSLFRSTKNREPSRTRGPPKTRVRLEDPYLHSMLGGDFTRSGRANGSSSVVQPQTGARKIGSTKPFKVLSAEYIKDDYYMDHLSWNDDNVLAIALDNAVYLYNCTSSEAIELASYNETIHWFRGSDHNFPSSVAWCNSAANSKYLAVGISSSVDIWDTQSGQKLRNLRGHEGRVLSLSWNQHCLTTGGKDSKILHHDVRCANSLVARCVAHEEEVAGLKWNQEGDMLASGGGDMMLCIWDLRMASSGRNRSVEPRLKLREHESSVNAIDWNPHHRGVLASGGGTDGTIKIWNSQTGAILTSTETGSHVSSVNWSQHRNELCSAHGGSNALTLWKYHKGSSLTKMTDFVGHDSRILSTACSPDGSQVASASADETIRFWDVFGEPVRKPSSSKASSIWGEVSLGDHVIR